MAFVVFFWLPHERLGDGQLAWSDNWYCFLEFHWVFPLFQLRRMKLFYMATEIARSSHLVSDNTSCCAVFTVMCEFAMATPIKLCLVIVRRVCGWCNFNNLLEVFKTSEKSWVFSSRKALLSQTVRFPGMERHSQQNVRRGAHEPKGSALRLSTITVLSSQYFCDLDHLCQVCSKGGRTRARTRV